MKNLLILPFVLLSTIFSFAQDGSVDLTFNPLGAVGANDQVRAMTVQDDDKIIIVGQFTDYNGTAINRIARLNPNGSLDASFNSGTGADNTILATVTQADGKIIIGGAFTSYNGVTRNRIARLNADGSLDTSFDPLLGANSNIFGLTVQTDGKIIIGGIFTDYNGTARNSIARLNANGSLDTSFDPGTGANNIVINTVLQPDGKVIIGGYFTNYNGTARNRIARLNIDGSIDTSFDPGTGANNHIRAVTIQTNGKILIGGFFTLYNGVSRVRIARLNIDGSLDTSFNPGTGPNGTVYSMVVQPDGRIVVGGIFTNINGNGRTRIAQLNTNGGVTNFASGLAGVNNDVYSVAIQGSIKIIISGKFTSSGSNSLGRVCRLESSNIAGCPNLSTDTRTECDSLIWIDGNTYYVNNNTATHTLTNVIGCDSIVTLDLTINSSTTGTDTRTECDSLVWIDGNTYHTNNNMATFNITGGAANMCDSLVTLDLTINNSATGTDTRTECDSLLWIDGNTYYANNNSATFNIAGGAANMCDSLVTLDLTINTINSSITQAGTLLTADEVGASYQWVDCDNANAPIALATNASYTVTSNGNYAVEITVGSCTDLSACVNVNSVEVSENSFSNKLTVYPNPTNGNFSIDLGEGHKIVTITITDVVGKVIQSKQHIQTQLLNLKLEAKAGIYLLVVESETKKSVIRLVKE